MGVGWPCRDARGRWVRLHPEEPAVQTPGSFDDLPEKIKKLVLAFAAVTLLVFLVSAVRLVWISWLDYQSSSDQGPDLTYGVIFTFALIPIALMPLVVAEIVFGKREDNAVAIAGVCRSCLYPLGGLAKPQDGCVVCPECGAAWRLGSVDER